MPLMWSLVIGLVAFRLYRLAGIDDITEPLHGRINAASGRNRAAAWVAELMACAWCLGFWFSAIVTGTGWALGVFTPYEAVTVTLAASAVCGIVARIDRLLERTERILEETEKQIGT